jgi:hypothetical protein
MFYKQRWIEVLYSLCGHVVVVTWFLVLGIHLCSVGGRIWLVNTLRSDPNLLAVLSLTLLLFFFAFFYAVLCSSAVLMQFFKQFDTALRMYKLTLRLRQMLPFCGTTTRVDVWRISLANCYREQSKFDEAEELYMAVLNNLHENVLTRITNYGLKDVARENLVALLELTDRNSEALELKSKIGRSADWIRVKYLLTSISILCLGMFFAFIENEQLEIMLSH